MKRGLYTRKITLDLPVWNLYLPINIDFFYLLPARHAARPWAGLFFVEGESAILEPSIKRTAAFIDGQNLFYSAKEAFGRHFPDYDPIALTPPYLRPAERLACDGPSFLHRHSRQAGQPFLESLLGGETGHDG